jgi:hypothetical protein
MEKRRGCRRGPACSSHASGGAALGKSPSTSSSVRPATSRAAGTDWALLLLLLRRGHRGPPRTIEHQETQPGVLVTLKGR